MERQLSSFDKIMLVDATSKIIYTTMHEMITSFG